MAALAAFLPKDNYVPRFDLPVIPPLQDYAPRPRTLRLRLERGLSQGILDRRRFYIGSVPPVARIGTRPNTELQPVPFNNPGLSRLAFSIPRNVLICIRRKQRKQVLFATGKAGKSGQKKPKWTEDSFIRC